MWRSEKSLKSKEREHVHEALRPLECTVYLYILDLFILSILAPVSPSYALVQMRICTFPDLCQRSKCTSVRPVRPHHPGPVDSRHTHTHTFRACDEVACVCLSSAHAFRRKRIFGQHLSRIIKQEAASHFCPLNDPTTPTTISPPKCLPKPQQRRGEDETCRRNEEKTARHKEGGAQNWDRR